MKVDGRRLSITEELPSTEHPALELRVEGRVAGLILPHYDKANRYTEKWFFVTVGHVFPHRNTHRRPAPRATVEEEALCFAAECLEDGAHYLKD